MKFSAFAEAADAVGATTRKGEKIERVRDYLISLPTEEAAGAALFLTGRAFAKKEETVLNVGGSLVWQAIAAVCGCPSAEMEAA